MTVCSEAADPAAGPPGGGIVLAGLGGPPGSGLLDLAPMTQVAEQLAAVLGCSRLQLDPDGGPDRGLEVLARTRPAGWLAPLSMDVGVPLPDGRSWAEALGAWRQPTLLVIPSAQLVTGLPAAGCALLRRWRVPLLGLLQWGLPWNGEERLRDGLPWLGVLPCPASASSGGAPEDSEARSEAEQALMAALTLQWRQLASG